MIELKIEVESMAEIVDELRILADKIEGGARSSAPQTEKDAPAPKSVPVAEPKTEEPEEKPDPAQRRFGKTDGEHARRTKAQMEEDDEIAALCEKLGVKVTDFDMPATDLRAKLSEMANDADHKPEEPKANISESPEDRKDPAEEEAGEATREQMMNAMRAFVNKHGMPAAQERMKEWTGGYEKQSEVPEDPALFAKVVARIEADHEALSNG